MSPECSEVVWFVAESAGGLFELKEKGPNGVRVVATMSLDDAARIAALFNAGRVRPQAESLSSKVALWLARRLQTGPARLSDLRAEVEVTGRCSAKTLYRAAALISVHEYGDRGNIWWRLSGDHSQEQPGA